MLRLIAGSYWAAAALLLVTTVLHVRWYAVGEASGAEVLSGFGSTLVVIGILLGSRPYLRAGISRLVYDSFSGVTGPYPGDTVVRKQIEHINTERPKVVVDIWTERVVAVVVVMTGTLLNGYGPFITRLLNLR